MLPASAPLRVEGRAGPKLVYFQQASPLPQRGQLNK